MTNLAVLGLTKLMSLWLLRHLKAKEEAYEDILHNRLLLHFFSLGSASLCFQGYSKTMGDPEVSIIL